MHFPRSKQRLCTAQRPHHPLPGYYTLQFSSFTDKDDAQSQAPPFTIAGVIIPQPQGLVNYKWNFFSAFFRRIWPGPPDPIPNRIPLTEPRQSTFPDQLRNSVPMEVSGLEPLTFRTDALPTATGTEPDSGRSHPGTKQQLFDASLPHPPTTSALARALPQPICPNGPQRTRARMAAGPRWKEFHHGCGDGTAPRRSNRSRYITCRP